MTGGLSPKTVKDLLTLIKSILKYGIAKELLPSSILAFSMPKVLKKDIEILSLADQKKLEQVTIGRYETGVAEPPLQKLLWYADFFDVSLDYIFGRTDNPQGMQKYPAIKSVLAKDGGLEALMEMCFTPVTLFNDRLKETIAQVLQEVKNE